MKYTGKVWLALCVICPTFSETTGFVPQLPKVLAFKSRQTSNQEPSFSIFTYLDNGSGKGGKEDSSPNPMRESYYKSFRPAGPVKTNAPVENKRNIPGTTTTTTTPQSFYNPPKVSTTTPIPSPSVNTSSKSFYSSPSANESRTVRLSVE
jgi:hypothetical protein